MLYAHNLHLTCRGIERVSNTKGFFAK
jgi:hypothetical protein